MTPDTRPDTVAALAGEFQRLIDTEAAIDDTACILRVEVPGVGVWDHVAGGLVRGGERALAATPFRIASITKTATAVVVTQLAAEGRLGLDDPFALHLPPDHLDLVDRVHVLDGVNAGPGITVRQLLTHASGLFDYAQSAGFYERIIADPGRPWTPREMVEGAMEWGTPHFAPGQGYGYAYSDTGYVLLGLIIEHLDARPLHDSYRARILDPLGMTNTYLEGFEEHRGLPMAHAHEGEFDVAPIHGSADWAGGGLVSDTADLATFATALVDGRLLDSVWLDELLHWRFRTLDPERHSPGYLGYGLGVEARLSNGFLLRGHRGHWGAWMHVDPPTRLTITGTINQADRPPHPVVTGVTAALRASGLLGGVAA